MIGRIYTTWQQFFEDIELMCGNAMQYNEDASEVFKDALQIQVGYVTIPLSPGHA
jgi:hypothetical protein